MTKFAIYYLTVAEPRFASTGMIPWPHRKPRVNEDTGDP